MTDSMKFGPEWLRNLSTDSSSSASLGNSAGSNSSSNSGGTNNNHTSNANFNHHASNVAGSTPRNMFPEFRYGREEMLSLFDKNCNMPEILPLYKKICVEKVQIPLALTPTSEDEISQNSQVPTQRQLWMQRSPLGFSSSVRGLSRGGSVERGRMRGKPMYTTFQRAPAVFEEDARPGLLKPERSWYERNGGGDTTVVNSSSGNCGLSSGSEWNGGGTPHTSPRREFSNHSRNMENWRRNRNDDGAGEPTTEGWRNSSSTHSFSGMQRWGRSTSWRDEEGTPNEVPGVSNNSSTIQRSFSNISTTLTSGIAMQKNANGKLFAKTGNFPSTEAPPTKNNQWSAENGTAVRLQDGEDNLPEWATDVPLEGGGSFDATGAFLGSAGEEVREIRDCFEISEKEESDSALNTSGKNSDALSPLDGQSNSNQNSDQSTPLPEHTEIPKNNPKSTEEIGVKMALEHSVDTLASSLVNEKKESVPTMKDTVSNSQVPQATQSTQPGQRRLSDHMIEAADDMVKKLINDDDISDIEKSKSSSSFSSVNSNPMKTASNLEQSLLANQNIHTTDSNNSVNVAPGDHKGMFFYGNLQQAQVQQPPLQHQFHPTGLIHNDVSPIPPHSGSQFWYYRDPQTKVQGPFAALEMTEWYRAGYFNENLLVRRACDTRFRALGDLIKTCQNNMPFTHSSLLATINMESVSLIPQHQKEQSEELKGVTAAADTLSAAVKNMSSVDMLHMLNVHFQLLQEQYLRRQEINILSELAKNEAFHRLSPAEREAIVRQKAQINGLPEYLTSLTNLGNTLVTLNPSAGTQLFNAILECSKKDSQQPMFPHPTPLSSNYMDVGEFILSMQRQQQHRHVHPQPHQSPHPQQQNQHPQQQLPCQAPTPFTGFEGNVGADNLLSNGILEDLNIRMLLSGNSTHPPQPLVAHLAPKPVPQELGNNAHGGTFLTEQQILASSGAVAANTSQSPLLQMWLPSTTSNMLGTPHSPQVHNPQLPQQQQPQNQWSSGGSLVGIPNVIGAESSPSEPLTVTPVSAPTSMWVNIKSPQNNDLVTGEDETHLEDCDQKSFSKEEVSNFESKNNTSSSTSSQYQNIDENLSQSYLKSNRNEEINQSVEKQTQQSLKNKKQNQNQNASSTAAVNPKLKDDFKKVDSEEKRRQKEERKRQQLEEEKRRLQQLEQERRRQMQEEDDRQKQIQAQRRKALLGSGNSNENSPSTTQKGYKDQKVTSSSVAPWSAQSTTASATSSLAEIQKAERRERRADQQRQLEMLEKQVRLNTAAALEANEAVPKWNASPVQAKSITEIQAEEAKKLNSEALFGAQRRKELEIQSVFNMLNINNAVGNASGSASTWNNVAQNKFWGSNASNNPIASGFWEEPAKQKPVASGSSTGTFAAAIFSGKQQNNNPQKQQPSNSATVTARNLKKSQTVSVMQNTPSASASASANVSKNSKGGSSSQQTQNNTVGVKQANNNKTANTDKKGGSSSKNSNGSGNPGSSKDEFENEFINWCMKSLNNMKTKVDVPTFVTFLRDLESPYEVKDYIRIYLGESKEFNDFAKQFLERRSKYKNLQRAQNAHNDDMCKPAPAITPSAGNDNSDSKNKQKKLKKNKMTKLDARILGFSVTAAEGRINVGDRDYVDSP